MRVKNNPVINHYDNVLNATKYKKVNNDTKIGKITNAINKNIVARIATLTAGLTAALQAGVNHVASGLEELAGSVVTLDKNQARNGAHLILQAGYHAISLAALGVIGLASPRQARYQVDAVTRNIHPDRGYLRIVEKKDEYGPQSIRLMSVVRGVRYGIKDGLEGMNLIINAPFSGKAKETLKNGGKYCWSSLKMVGRGFAGIFDRAYHSKLNLKVKQ